MGYSLADAHNLSTCTQQIKGYHALKLNFSKRKRNVSLYFDSCIAIFFSYAFMKLLMWKPSSPWQLSSAAKCCVSLVGLHLTLFNFYSGVHKMAISIMHSMFPEIVGTVNIHLSLLSHQQNMSFVVPTHQQDFQACHYCLFIIMFYNPPLHTRAQFASSCNALASSSNPLVVSQPPQHSSLFKIFYY